MVAVGGEAPEHGTGVARQLTTTTEARVAASLRCQLMPPST